MAEHKRRNPPRDAIQEIIREVLTNDELGQPILYRRSLKFWQVGRSARFHNMRKEALIAFERQAQLTARDHKNWIAWGETLLQDGQFLPALEKLRRARELIKKALKRGRDVHPDVRFRLEMSLAETYHKLERRQGALAAWQRAIEACEGDSGQVIKVGQRMRQAGHIQEAHELLLEQLEENGVDKALQAEAKRLARILEPHTKPGTQGQSRSCKEEKPPLLKRAKIVHLRQSPKERIGVFADVSNLWNLMKSEYPEAVGLDYNALLAQATKGRRLAIAMAFVPDIPETQADRRALQAMGFIVRAKGVKWQNGRRKSNADSALVAWAMYHLACDQIDVLEIWGSDGDLAEIVEPARRLRPRLTISFRGFSNGLGREIRETADRWSEITGSYVVLPYQEAA